MERFPLGVDLAPATESEATLVLEHWDDGRFVLFTRDDGVTQPVAPHAMGPVFQRWLQSGGNGDNLRALLDLMESRRPGFRETWEHRAFLDSQPLETLREHIWNELGLDLEPGAIALTAEIQAGLFPVVAALAMDPQQSGGFWDDGFYALTVPSPWAPHHSARDLHQFTVDVTGVWRRDLARGLLRLGIAQISLVATFAPHLDPSHLATVVDAACPGVHSLDVSLVHDSSLARFLSRLPRTLVPRLLGELLALPAGLLDDFRQVPEDTLAMVGQVPPGDLGHLRAARTWAQLHALALRWAVPEVGGDGPLVLPGAVRDLGLAPVLGRRVVPLMLESEFGAMGAALGNCLGKSNYFAKAQGQVSHCLVVLGDGEPVAALEVGQIGGTWRAFQLRGPGNGSLPWDGGFREAVEARMNGFSMDWERWGNGHGQA